MRLRRFFVIVTLCFNLTVVVFTQDSPASTQRQELICRDSWVEWPSFVSDRGVLLVVSGPQGLYVKRSHPAGEWPRFSLLDDEGRPRPDGIYKWEVVGQAAAWGDAGPASPLKSEVQSGWFEIRAGKAVSEQTAGEKWPITVEAEAPENSIRVDREGRVGVGTSVPGAKLHVKGADPGLAIEDTQPGGHEYVLRSHESGDGSLGLFDETKGEARWLVDGEGRIGINTTQPTSTFTVDGYVESTKGFLVNGRPLTALGGFVGSQPLATETNSNNFFGTGAGGANTSGYANSFFGGVAGASNTTGYANSFFGRFAGYANTEGGANSFYGMNAGQYNSVGNCNSFFGASAGFANTEGSFNSFFGGGAGFANTTGHDNSFFGRSTGDDNTTGSYNSFFGVAAGNINQSGTRITALGYLSGGHNTVEPNNTFLGAHADLDPGTSPGTTPVTNATAIGYRAYVSQSNSLVLGGVRGFNAVTTETLVGIGTTSPDRQLVVEGSQAIGKFRRYNDTTAGHAPAFLFERARGTSTQPLEILANDYLGKVQFRGRAGTSMVEYGALAFIASDKNQNGRFSFIDRDLATERMVVLNTGNVGIGTSTPTARLDVAGDVRVRGTIVYGAPAIAVPDYVFGRDYQLMPLSELEQYVTREKHLPNVPNAGEIQENGVDVGQFQMRLLEKIEELTLYTVAQAKVIDRQNSETADLKERIGVLEQTIKQLLAERDRD